MKRQSKLFFRERQKERQRKWVIEKEDKGRAGKGAGAARRRPTSRRCLPLEPASKTPPCRHPGEIAVWGGQPRFPVVATSAPGPGWPSQDRNIMPTESSFHPARVYRVLRASFSHSGDVFASFRAPWVSGAPVSRMQVFHAQVEMSFSLVKFLFRRVRESHALVEYCFDSSSLECFSRVYEFWRIRNHLSVASFSTAVLPLANPLNR